MQAYYDKNGKFGSAHEMGFLNSDTGSGLPNPTSYNANISSISVYQLNSGKCGVIAVVIPGTNLGVTFDSFGSNQLQYTYRMNVSNSVYKRYCGTIYNQTADYQYIPSACVCGLTGAPTAPGGTFSTASNAICE